PTKISTISLHDALPIWVTNYVERNADNGIRTNLSRVYDRDNRQTSEVDATQVYNGASKTDSYVYNADGTLKQIVTSNVATGLTRDRKSTRLNSSHDQIS